VLKEVLVFKWLKKALKPRRKVFLILSINKLYVSKVVESDAGFVAHWYSNPVVLLGDGKATGHSIVKGWLPHKGWSAEDLNSMIKTRS
jgi:hypothetical protein